MDANTGRPLTGPWRAIVSESATARPDSATTVEERTAPPTLQTCDWATRTFESPIALGDRVPMPILAAARMGTVGFSWCLDAQFIEPNQSTSKITVALIGEFKRRGSGFIFPETTRLAYLIESPEAYRTFTGPFALFPEGEYLTANWTQGEKWRDRFGSEARFCPALERSSLECEAKDTTILNLTKELSGLASYRALFAASVAGTLRQNTTAMRYAEDVSRARRLITDVLMIGAWRSMIRDERLVTCLRERDGLVDGLSLLDELERGAASGEAERVVMVGLCKRVEQDLETCETKVPLAGLADDSTALSHLATLSVIDEGLVELERTALALGLSIGDDSGESGTDTRSPLTWIVIVVGLIGLLAAIGVGYRLRKRSA